MLNDVQLKALVEKIENDVFKDYLREFSSYQPIPLDKYDVDSWKENRIRNIKVSKFIKLPDDTDIDNLCQLFQSFNGDDCTISILYNHTKNGLEIYFRIADVRESVSSSGQVNALSDRAKRIFSSVFSGTEIEEQQSDRNIINTVKHIVSVTNLASEKSDSFISLENIFNFHDEKEYSILLLAKPINNSSDLKLATNSLCTYLSEISEYESQQITNSKTSTKSKSGNFSVFIASAGLTSSDTEGINSSKTISNYSVKHMTEQINKSLDRLERCKAMGGWEFATYVLSDSLETAKSVAYQYDAVVRGKNSNSAISAVIPWGEDESKVIFEYLFSNQHPIFENQKSDRKDLTSQLSSIDLSHAMNFPRKSVPGFSVAECVSFGRNVSLLDKDTSSDKLEIGNIWHMRHKDAMSASLDVDLLTSHVFITGSTGSGKSNTVYQLLNKLDSKGKKFLVVEPTKGEYKAVFGGRNDVFTYGTNYKHTNLLRINPFSFPEGVQLYSHLDRLIEIFNACWPMYAAMPAILKDAIERAYIEAGWDLCMSENKEYGRLFPTFTDVLRQIDIVMNESDYSGDSKGDYKGALKTRLKSLTNGIFGIVFGSDEISDKDLFDENVIVDLSEIGPETTSLIMGMLVLKLQEYRMTSKVINSELKHITVLEEAHNLLKRTSTEQSYESFNLVGKSVEMITNAIAEMRTYGECFMIVDQAPGALDPAAIRNTNTKIVLRLPDYNDRELVGKAIGLNDPQIIELSKLERGVAAVYQSGWIESVLCKFDKFDDMVPLKGRFQEFEVNKSASILLNAVLYGTKFPEMCNVIKSLKNSLIYKSTLPLSVKHSIWKICQTNNSIDQRKLANLAYELLDADMLFSDNNKSSTPSKVDYARQYRRMLQIYHITDIAMQQANISTLMSLINQEHQHKGKDFMDTSILGGVR